MVREAAELLPAVVYPAPVLAALITDDAVLARTLRSLLREVPAHVVLTVVRPDDLDTPVIAAPDIVFVDVEGKPSVLKTTCLRYPESRCVAIVGSWSETVEEVRGRVPHVLYKPLRAAAVAAVLRVAQSWPQRLTA